MIKQKKYFQDILSFFEIPEGKFIYPQKPKFKKNTHLRKGSINEWRNVLNENQIERINNSIPDDWFDRFNWPRE